MEEIMFKNIMLAIIALSSVVVAVSSVIYVVKMPSCDPMAVIAKWEETKAALKEQPEDHEVIEAAPDMPLIHN